MRFMKLNEFRKFQKGRATILVKNQFELWKGLEIKGYNHFKNTFFLKNGFDSKTLLNY